MKCECPGPICSCGAAGTVKDGAGVSVPLLMFDSATGPRVQNASQLSAADRQMLVVGKPLHVAAASSLYDEVRGSITGGMPAEEWFALQDGAVAMPHIGGLPPTERNIADAGDRLGAQIAYERRISDAWKQQPGAIGPVRAALQSQDRGAPLTNDNGQAAYEARLKAAWR